jgi:hypothetical protein
MAKLRNLSAVCPDASDGVNHNYYTDLLNSDGQAVPSRQNGEHKMAILTRNRNTKENPGYVTVNH